MTDGPETGTVWIAALEQLPPDARGFRRTLRLHAVATQDSGPAPRAACGYSWRPAELRPDRPWHTVTATGRCALCDLQLRRARTSGVELTESVDLADPGAADRPDGRPRLSVVPVTPEPVQPDSGEPERGDPERRSPDRP